MDKILYNIKTGFRYFARQKNTSILNILGLSIGMSVAILIFYFVNFERGYDKFHKDGKLIYRIISINKGTGGTDYRATTPVPLAETIRSDLREAEMTTALTYFLNEDEPVVVGDQTWFNLTGLTADPSFLKIFNFPLITGDVNKLFDNPGSVVLTRSTAVKLFGNEDPSGQKLTIGENIFTVNGILKDLPGNSVFKFDLLVSDLILKKMHSDFSRLWAGGGSQTFVKIYPGQNVSGIKAGLSAIPDKYFPDFLKGRETYDIQPLGKIHLEDSVIGNDKQPLSVNYLFILTAIALAVLFIACVNYVNLSTSQSEKRAKETAIRKLSGGGRFHIFCLFISESVVLSLIAVIIAVFLSKLLLPWFNELSERNLIISLTNWKFISLVLLFGILTGVLSALYPAILFSKYEPVQMFSPGKGIMGGKTGFRKGFIVAQFLITIVLIISQLFISRQVSFMKKYYPGFNKNDLVSIPLYCSDDNKRLSFAKLFMANLETEAATYGIKGISLTENVPGQNFPNRFAVIPEGDTPDNSKEMIVTSIDEHFADVFQVSLVNGRWLSDTIASDRFDNVMINETAARKFGWNEPLGKKLRFKHEKDYVKVIGVLKDINFKSVQTPVEPVVYRYTGANWLAGYITVRLSTGNSIQTIKFIKTTCAGLAPDVPFQYFFIKDKYAEKYRGEERLAKTIGTFALLAVFLSCLGLFSMLVWISSRRTKEIGIRKINGAGVGKVIIMLSSDFIRLVLVAFVIACPAGLYIMHKWLENFAYKTKLSWWIFGYAGIIALGIALLTVIWKSWHAATRNPVDSLRHV